MVSVSGRAGSKKVQRDMCSPQSCRLTTLSFVTFLDLSKTCEKRGQQVFWLVCMVIGMDDIIVTFYMVQRRGHAKETGRNKTIQTKRVFF